MARPLRPQWRPRTVIRRRHRTWMASMILATCGWGLWWLALAAHRFAPALFPGLLAVYVLTGAVAAVGLFLAVFTVRARLIWVLLAGVPVMANGTLLMLPVVVDDAMLRAFRGDEESSRAEVRGPGLGWGLPGSHSHAPCSLDTSSSPSPSRRPSRTPSSDRRVS